MNTSKTIKFKAIVTLQGGYAPPLPKDVNPQILNVEGELEMVDDASISEEDYVLIETVRAIRPADGIANGVEFKNAIETINLIKNEIISSIKPQTPPPKDGE
jgi:hypothetical protein